MIFIQTWKKQELEKLNENFVKIIHQDWAVLTVAGPEKTNAMTVNWVQIGWLWNKPVVTVYVRPQRYTYPLINHNENFSLAFFEESERSQLAYLGKASGQMEDKLAHCGYTLLSLDQIPAIEQARLILTCRILYQSDLVAEQFHDPTIPQQWYDQGDFHRSYVAEILNVWQKE